MKARWYEKGDATAVVFAVLVVLLMAALGVIFYQNFIAKEKEKPVQQEVDSEQQVKATISNIAFDSMIFSLAHPEGWRSDAKHYEDAQNYSSTITVTSPEQTVQVVLSIFSGGGLGGRCDPSGGLKVRYHTTYPEPVTQLIDAPLYLVEAISDYPDGGYRYEIGLAPDGGKTNASVGSSSCTVKDTGLILNVASRQSGDPINILAEIVFPKLSRPEESKIDSMDELKAILSTDDYKTAVQILQSVRKE